MRSPWIDEMVQELWNEAPGGRWTSALRNVIRTFSMPYGSVIAARNRLYDKGLVRQHKLPCPVISVGNLTVGGTGKTPAVIFIANLLKDHGYRPAVLSRGYGGAARGPVNMVSDGNDILMGWREAGDEPVLIARSAPGIPVLTGSRRFLTGRAAVESFGADVLILDDAFQHRSLFRDIDIVLLDAVRPFGNGYLLPGGPLREPPAALDRADILLHRGETEDQQPLPAALSLTSFRAFHEARGVVSGRNGQMDAASVLQGQKVFAFAGIGSPESFRKSLSEQGAIVAGFRIFPDHHPYSSSDIQEIRRLAAGNGIDRIVTTEKDGVRLADFPDFMRELFLLRIGINVSPADMFAEAVFRRLETACSGRRSGKM